MNVDTVEQKYGQHKPHNKAVWIIASALVLAFSSSCVSPGEFDGLENSCEGQRFDAPSRSEYCSGTWSSRPVTVDGLSQNLSTASKPLVHIQGDWLTTVQAINEGREVDVKVFKKDALGRYLPELSRTLDLPESTTGARGQLTSAVMMGLSDERSIETSVLAVVQNRRELVMIDVAESNFRPPELGAIRADDYASEEWIDPQIQRNCIDSQGVGNQEFADLATFSPGGTTFDNRQYVVVAARCAMVVYAYEPDLLPTPTPLIQIPTEAIDVEIDEANDRMLIATGLQGLTVRSLSDFQSTIDREYENVVAVMGSPTSNDGVGGGDEDPDLLENRNSFSPTLDPGKYTETNPSVNALLNVTKVGFSGDRVFFINEATVEGDTYDGLTFLVAGKLNANGTFDELTSVPVSNDDFEFDNVNWELVSLKDSYFAVLRNSEKITEAGLAKNSQVKLFDSPVGHKPIEVFTIPTTSSVSTILEEEGELWVVQSDTIFAYDFNISGAPLSDF